MTSDRRQMISLRGRLSSGRRRLLALSAAMAALAVAAPVSTTRAQVVPGGIVQGGQANGSSVCVDANAPSGVGDAGATVNQICGVAITAVGASTGQLATAIGPMIVGSTVVAPITVSPGPVAVTSLP
jgi:hypothetical protein